MVPRDGKGVSGSRVRRRWAGGAGAGRSCESERRRCRRSPGREGSSSRSEKRRRRGSSRPVLSPRRERDQNVPPPLYCVPLSCTRASSASQEVIEPGREGGWRDKGEGQCARAAARCYQAGLSYFCSYICNIFYSFKCYPLNLNLQ